MARDGIYLYGYYGQGNLGDDLLMTAAVGMIRTVRPDAIIFVHCRDRQALPDLGDENLKPVPAAAILADRNIPRAVRFFRHFAALRHAFKHCNTLIFGGGTVLQESQSPISIILIAVMVELAHRMGLRTILLGSGLGAPKTGWGRKAAAHVLNRVTLAALRDGQSVALAQALAPDTTIRETADLVFSLPTKSGQEQADLNATGIAVSIQPSITTRQDETGAKARSLLAGCVTGAVASDRPVSLLVLETKVAEGGIDDRAAWRAIVSNLIDDPSANVRLVSADTNNAAALFSGVSVHVGQRFHGHVLAALSGIPFVGLSHDVKITEICKRLTMPCLSIEEATTEALHKACELAERSRPGAETLDDLRRRSSDNISCLQDVLNTASA